MLQHPSDFARVEAGIEARIEARVEARFEACLEARDAAGQPARADVAEAAADAALQRRLLRRALRLLDDVAEAEDTVQDAWLRWHVAVRVGAAPDNVEAWLVTVVTRLCLDRLRHATVVRLLTPATDDVARPRSLGAGAPEDVLDDTRAARGALARVLAALSPLEAAALLLVEVCDLDHREAAALLGRSEAASRQLLRRARRRLPRPPVPSTGGGSRVVHAREGGDGGDGAVEAETRANVHADAASSTTEPALLDRCLAAIRSADHRGLVAAVLRGEPVVATPSRIRWVTGPDDARLLMLGAIVLARLPGLAAHHDALRDAHHDAHHDAHRVC